jgi:nucleoside-diphosphate-sugar epimerase
MGQHPGAGVKEGKMRALVFGASGQVGRAIARDLAEAGWQVHATSRTNRPLAEGLAGLGVQAEPAEASRAALIRRLGALDAVVDPLAFDAKDAADLLAERGRVGAYVVISTTSVYADDQGRGFETDPDFGFPVYPDPVLETQGLVPPGPGYSAGKVALEQTLEASGTPVAILRPAAIHGIGARHPREFWFLKRALDGRPLLPLVQAGETVFHTSSTTGIASLTRHVLTHGLNGAFNVTDPRAPTTAEVARAVAAHVGHAFQVIDSATLPGAEEHVGHSPLSVAAPMRFSTQKARATGWDGGPDYADGLAAYLDWMIPQAEDWRRAFATFAQYGHDPFDYAAEDRALRAAGLI